MYGYVRCDRCEELVLPGRRHLCERRSAPRSPTLKTTQAPIDAARDALIAAEVEAALGDWAIEDLAAFVVRALDEAGLLWRHFDRGT